MKREFTAQEAKQIGDKVGIDFNQVNLEQFRLGLAVELEHGARDSETNVTNDDLLMTAKIAWAHLKELDDYYSRLNQMESEAEPGRDGTHEIGADREEARSNGKEGI